MPKPKGRNAFYFFMLDWKKQAEARGKKFPQGLKDVQADPECSEQWRNMTKQQKGNYEKMAKDSKIAAQGKQCKLTTLGEPIEYLENEERKKQEFQETMYQYISSMVCDGFKHENLQKLKFCFIHVNWFFVRDLGNNKSDYFPAEFAISEFSLENGTERFCHEIINAKIPLGYTREAKETSQNYHKIPIEFPEGKSFDEIYEIVVNFLQPRMIGNKYPPLYCLSSGSIYEAAESFLRHIADAAGEDEDLFPLYSIELLFKMIITEIVSNQTVPMDVHLTVSEHEFAKDIYSCERGFECDFHKNIDGTAQYCSLSTVKRWGFMFCSYCCEFFGIEMKANVHLPPRKYLLKDDNSLDKKMSTLSLENISPNIQRSSSSSSDVSKLVKGISVLSMTGVSEEHRRKTSERTYEEEQRRRKESKPVDIIDHSKLKKEDIAEVEEVVEPQIPERPLRLPRSQSNAWKQAVLQDDRIPDMDDANFPPIGGGRGIPKDRKKVDAKFPFGRGHGSR